MNCGLGASCAVTLADIKLVSRARLKRPLLFSTLLPPSCSYHGKGCHPLTYLLSTQWQ